MSDEESQVLVEGPWRHRDVTASGLRFHVAEHGPAGGPLVLLLHGFPEFWWSWRHQLVALGDAGFHAVAPDLRGYGATDKPPRGYDAYTLANDVAGLVRALGHHDAWVVGHDWGGSLAWATATLHPRVVNRLAVLSCPHPLRVGDALRRDGAQRRMSSYMGLFQLPRLPERRLVRGGLVTELMDRWGGPGFPDPETARRCRDAMRIPAAAHCALEYYRWSFRSQVRPSGRRYMRLLATGVSVPVLHLHGDLDGCLLTTTAHGSGAFAHGGYELQVLEGLGHFPHEEDPELVSSLLLDSVRPPGS
ncbi:MAG TPA: alpha/beta hydrolase [Mycobacteriales bacterium]|nr:alpha/beta hydrolase [Mycobacteriales bacterium]